MNRFAILVAALVLSGVARSDERIDALTGNLESLRANFEQKVVDESGRLVEESSGRFALQAPNLLRWHYEAPFEQLIVADGRRVWIHDVELEQITVRDQDAAASSSPLYVLTRPETMKQRFAVDYAKDGGYETLLLQPRSAEAEFEWVEIGFVDQKLDFLLIQDAFGQQTQIRFIDPVYNTEIDPEQFTFEPPEGIDVIGSDELMTETFAVPDAG